MDRSTFIARFGGVYEHSPWAAERAFDRDGGADPAGTMRQVVEDAAEAERHALLCAHPDLAGRLALAGGLTADSTREQAGAGLDQCSAEELAAFTDLNTRYTARFGFPFIIAVKGLTRAQILTAFRARIDNAPAAEFRTALNEVHKIAAFRIADVQM